MVRRSSSGDSLSLRDFADDFFSQPQTKMKSNPSPSRRSINRLSSRESEHSFSVEDLASSRHSINLLSRRESTGNLSMPTGRSNNIRFSRRGSTGHIFDRSFTGDDLVVAQPSSRGKRKSLGKSAISSHHGGAEDFSSSLHSFSALLRKSSMEAELRLSQQQNDVRSKANGFFDMPTPPFPFSPNDVRFDNIISSSNRTSSTQDGDDDIHGKSDKSPRSTKSTYNPKPSRRWSSPADISHNHRASEKGRSSRRHSLQPASRDNKEHNPYVVNERQSPLRHGSSSSIGNSKHNQKGTARSSSTSEDTKKSYPSTSHVKKYLQHYADALRLPAGFIASLMKAYKSTDSRLWLMENTSSMKIRDSHRAKIDASLKYIRKDGGHSRWTELSQTVDFHVKMSARCFIPTKFWLVNDPGSSVGPQRFSVAWGNHDDVKAERTIALDMMKRITLDTDQNHLTRQLRKIEKRVREEAPRLIAANKVVTVVLCTQGRQTDENGNEGPAVLKDCVDSLKALSKLPVKIVVRLCANDEKAEEFVSEIDCKLDSVVVLGDYWREAIKVHLHNPWLTYGLGIHRLREACLTSDLLNDLGRRAYTVDDIYEFCKEFLIGEKEIYSPHPRNSLDAFLRGINNLLEDEKCQWNPVKKKLTQWIDMSELERLCRSRVYEDVKICSSGQI